MRLPTAARSVVRELDRASGRPAALRPRCRQARSQLECWASLAPRGWPRCRLLAKRARGRGHVGARLVDDPPPRPAARACGPTGCGGAVGFLAQSVTLPRGREACDWLSPGHLVYHIRGEFQAVDEGGVGTSARAPFTCAVGRGSSSPVDEGSGGRLEGLVLRAGRLARAGGCGAGRSPPSVAMSPGCRRWRSGRSCGLSGVRSIRRSSLDQVQAAVRSGCGHTDSRARVELEVYLPRVSRLVAFDHAGQSVCRKSCGRRRRHRAARSCSLDALHAGPGRGEGRGRSRPRVLQRRSSSVRARAQRQWAASAPANRRRRASAPLRLVDRFDEPVASKRETSVTPSRLACRGKSLRRGSRASL